MLEPPQVWLIGRVNAQDSYTNAGPRWITTGRKIQLPEPKTRRSLMKINVQTHVDRIAFWLSVISHAQEGGTTSGDL